MGQELGRAWANLKLRFAHVMSEAGPPDPAPAEPRHGQTSGRPAAPRSWRSLTALDAVVWLATFLIYAATTARDILAADSGEFQLVAVGWGIGHPPGYPLYTVLSALWVRLLPLGTVPFRANLLSAALAATTLVLCLKTVRAWGEALGIPAERSTVGALITALALGSAATFWAQATTANIRMPTVLFTAWGYLALAQFHAARSHAGNNHHRRSRQDRALLSLGIVTGLGIGHHPSLAFVAVGWALTLLLLQPSLVLSPSKWLRPAAFAIVAWLVPQLYLPLRGSVAAAPLSPGDLATWQGFWDHVLARGFGGDMFAFSTARDLALRLPLMPSLFRMQFPAIILVAMVVAWLLILARDRRIAVALVVPWAIQSFVTITYRAPQTIEYLMPAYVPMALALGLGLAASLRSNAGRAALFNGRGAATMLTALIALILAAQLPGHLRDFAHLAADTSIRDYVEPILTAAPDDALILADWRWATPLWVLQQTENLNPAADIVYVTPEEDMEYESVWRQRATDAGNRPLFVTHAYSWEEWATAPVGGGLRLYRPPLQALPPELDFAPLQADLGPVRLLGARWRGEVRPGGTIELQLAWQQRSPTGDSPQDLAPSFATRLWDSDDNVLSAADRALGNEFTAGGVRFTRLTHQMPIDRCAPVVYPTVGVYTVADTGFQDLGSVSLPEIAATCEYPALPARRLWPGLAWPGGPLLQGIDYDAPAGGTTMAYLHWCGPGEALTIRTPAAEATVEPLTLGICQTTAIALVAPGERELELTRADGTPVTLLVLPLPQPREDERYLPFGDEMVLVDDELEQLRGPATSGITLLTLRWLAARPLVTDYAVSARLQDAEGRWLGAHDIQPGLGAIPTLKWVVRDRVIRDPHPVAGVATASAYYSVVVYDRFRLTPLRSVYGDEPRYQLP
ncbi:MAG: DUF2723 domain-containing protein [Anaerolineae bacterium]|nr:DUF2723 domain-containing protein [Anaerolineae bacterium]